jgi:multidrug transporter EmrE-like cation transporter
VTTSGVVPAGTITNRLDPTYLRNVWFTRSTVTDSMSYAVWTGIGAAGTPIIGMALLGESREALRILCIVLIVGGVVGLKFASAAGH